MATKKKETPAEKARRLGPSQPIVRRQRKSKTTQYVWLKCGERRSVDMTKRKTLRCHCAAKKAALKKAA